MDKKVLAALAVIVVVSGCTDIQGSNGQSSTGSVTVSHFSINDDSLRPGQEASISLIIENMDPNAEIEQLEILNSGDLEVESGDWTQRCSSSSLPDPVEDQPGVMECSWPVTAPSESQLGSLSSKTYSPQLMLRYSSEFSNSESPIKVESMQSRDIQNPQQVQRSFSNGEVSTQFSFENPAPVSVETPMDVSISASTQHVVSESYGFTLDAASTVESCSGEPAQNGRISLQVEPDPNGNARFSCTLSPGGETTRNLVFATSYKYQQSPSFTVEVVQN